MNAARIYVTEDTLQLTVVAHDGPQVFNLETVPPVELKIVLQKCGWCEKPFIQSTSYQKFCSVRCRVTVFRKREPEHSDRSIDCGDPLAGIPSSH